MPYPALEAVLMSRPVADISGQMIGKHWLVLETLPRQYGWTLCRVRCTRCGHERTARAAHLRARAEHSHSCCGARLDLNGKVFGDLLVIGPAPNVPGGARHLTKGYTAWRCRCKGCDREVVVPTHRLVTPRNPKRHCGCRNLLPTAPPEATSPITTSTDRIPERVTGAQAALDREAEALRPFGVSAGSRLHVDDEFNDGRAVTLDDFPNHEDNV